MTDDSGICMLNTCFNTPSKAIAKRAQFNSTNVEIKSDLSRKLPVRKGSRSTYRGVAINAGSHTIDSPDVRSLT